MSRTHLIRAAGVAAFAALALLVGGFFLLGGGLARQGADNGSAPTLAVLSSLLERSPGERSDAVGLIVKGARALGKQFAGAGDDGAPAPEQRALGKIFDETPEETLELVTGAPPVVATNDFGDPAQQNALGSATPADGGVGRFFGGSTPPVIGAVPLVPGGSSSSSSSGGSSSSSSGGSTSSSGGGEVPPVVSPVPEPQTWFLLLLGMFGTAVALRRKASTTRGQQRKCAA